MLCHPIWSAIILVIKQIGRPILLNTHMITDRIGLHSTLLLLLISKIQLVVYYQCCTLIG